VIAKSAVTDALATVHPTASVGERCVIWAWTQVRENAHLGSETSLGQSVYVGPGVYVGARCRVQNQALLYEPAVLEDNVFVGPGVVMTNDKVPRASNVDGSAKTQGDWEKVGVYVEYGASIGARAVLVGPVRIGRWAMVGAGSVVSKDVAPFALVVGTPATQVGWVGRHGARLTGGPDLWRCAVTGERYFESAGQLQLMDPQ
jgi:UDP-2-acetamido-3-amino-2,3-dideoxy-glucuronate N-acetyltransferase